jgi:hypothetical protein
MNKLLRECQRLVSLLDGTESDIGYPDNPGILGTGEVMVSYDLRTQGWRASANWGHGCCLSTPAGDYPKDAIRGLHRLLQSHLETTCSLSKRGKIH